MARRRQDELLLVAVPPLPAAGREPCRLRAAAAVLEPKPTDFRVAAADVVRETPCLVAQPFGGLAKPVQLFATQCQFLVATTEPPHEPSCLGAPPVAVGRKLGELMLPFGKTLFGGSEPRPVLAEMTVGRLGETLQLIAAALELRVSGTQPGDEAASLRTTPLTLGPQNRQLALSLGEKLFRSSQPSAFAIAPLELRVARTQAGGEAASLRMTPLPLGLQSRQLMLSLGQKLLRGREPGTLAIVPLELCVTRPQAGGEAACLLTAPLPLGVESRQLTLSLDQKLLRSSKPGALFLELAVDGLRQRGQLLASVALCRKLEPCTPGAAHKPFHLRPATIAVGGERRQLDLAFGEPLLGRGEPGPLFLQLCEHDPLAVGRRFGLDVLDDGLVGLRLGVIVRVGNTGERGPAAVVLVPPLNLSAEPGAEPGLGDQLDAVLRRECRRELRRGDEAALDDRLAEPAARRLLLRERELELLVGQEPLLDEQASERSPRDVGRFHTRYIGAAGAGVKTLCVHRRKCAKTGL